MVLRDRYFARHGVQRDEMPQLNARPPFACHTVCDDGCMRNGGHKDDAYLFERTLPFVVQRSNGGAVVARPRTDGLWRLGAGGGAAAERRPHLPCALLLEALRYCKHRAARSTV